MSELKKNDAMEMTDTHSHSTDQVLQDLPLGKSSIILIITRNGHLAEPLMDYAINVADRLKCRLLVAYVNTLPYLFDGGKRRNLLASAIQESVSAFQKKASERDVGFDYIRESGKISKVISRICHIVKRIEFVVIDKGIKMEEAVSGAPVPVFNVHYSDLQDSKIIDQDQEEVAESWLPSFFTAKTIVYTGICLLSVLVVIFSATIYFLMDGS